MLIRFFLLFYLFLTASVPAQELSIPTDTRQAVVVYSQSWDHTTATMLRFERADESADWTRVGKSVKVNLGRTGLAWGRSPLMKTPSGLKLKKEGDGRSPAGLFPILSAFGHPAPPEGYSEANLDFLTVTDQQAVDDSKSEYYNQIVRPAEVGGVSWNSAETMKIEVYRLGLVVGHNLPKAVPGGGSAIFFHLQTGPGETTAGCTSMTKGALTELVLWLEKEKNPVLLQLPREELRKLGEDFPSHFSHR
ncbi:MAG: L,D-transpeptidase family protein [Vulcanimicrobiota bacterium]